MRKFKSILVTGGCGFIGSNFIHYIFENKEFSGNIINLDKLTYAGNPENLSDITDKYLDKRYFFYKGDILDFNLIKTIMIKYQVDCIVHFAAESHVDRSISGPCEFISTNINGTFNLLEVCKEVWSDRTDALFHHVSTDEVYGTLGDEGFFYETTPYDPRSPYSASKAASDHLVRAYYHTYRVPVTISNCSNNYGPYQFPEKLIPLTLLNIFDEKKLPVYGKGENIRDWLYVDDHNSAIYKIITQGEAGETYNIGGENEQKNIDIVNLLCEKSAEKSGKSKNYYKKLITFVEDRPGHDFRYAINCDKIKNSLGWNQKIKFEDGIEKTIDWYLNNRIWADRIRSGEYREWIDKNYINRKTLS